MKTGRPLATALWQCLAFALLASVTACSRARPEPPRTYSVTGEIADAGGRNVAGTLIQFAPGNQEFRSQGNVGPDGKFSLKLLFDNEQLEGAIEGEHVATLYFPPDKAPADGQLSLRLEQPFLVRPGTNHFKIVLPPLTK